MINQQTIFVSTYVQMMLLGLFLNLMDHTFGNRSAWSGRLQTEWMQVE